MPVIGRLDGQVDEVLIAPLEKRRRRDEDQQPRDDEQRARDEDEQTRGDAKENRGEHGQRDEFENDAVRDELPVWLL